MHVMTNKIRFKISKRAIQQDVKCRHNIITLVTWHNYFFQFLKLQ